jgi:hypothetical protein
MEEQIEYFWEQSADRNIEEIHNLYTLPNIVRGIKPRMMK